MDAPHIHLLLNHFPTVGFLVGLAVFAAGLARRSDDLIAAGLVALFLTSALSLTTYVSGDDTEQVLKAVPGVSQPLIDAHENAALIALTAMQVIGLLSWITLWRFGSNSRFHRRSLVLVSLFAVAAFALMAIAANLGGHIRHPEIDDAQLLTWIPSLAGPWRIYVEHHSWVWPTCETVHFIGLSMLIGVVFTIDLRMLDLGKERLSFEALYPLLPVGVIGFGLNLITGMAFFVAKPEQYTGGLFLLKMLLILAGALNILYFMLGAAPWRVSDGDRTTSITKWIAGSGIVIWLGVLFCGHMLPWLGNSF